MLKKIKTEYISDFEKGPIRRSLFSNGATSLFHKAEGFVGAKVNLNFIAGSMFEKPNEHGLSHVIEHLVFKEVDSDIVSALELSGAEINAYTYKENVCFEMECLAKNLKELLPLFLDLFMTLDFTREMLTKEKKVICQELKEDKDDHEIEGLEYIFNKNFSDNIGHPIGGKISDVKRYKTEDIQKYHKKFYTPDRMILTVVSGKNFDSLEEIFSEKLKENYKSKPKNPFRLTAFDKLGKVDHFKTKLTRKMESSIVMFSFNGISLNSKSYYDLVVLDELFFEGMSSVFFKTLREMNPLIYGLGSSINSFSKTGNYVMVFNTQKANISTVKNEVKRIIDFFSDNAFPEEVVDSVKQRVLDNWELSFDDIGERAEFISDNEVYQLNEHSLDRVKGIIQQTNAHRMQKLLKKLIKNGYSELVIGPK